MGGNLRKNSIFRAPEDSLTKLTEASWNNSATTGQTVSDEIEFDRPLSPKAVVQTARKPQK